MLSSIPFLTTTQCCPIIPTSPHISPHSVSARSSDNLAYCYGLARWCHRRKRIIETFLWVWYKVLRGPLLDILLFYFKKNTWNPACRILRWDIINGDMKMMMPMVAHICWALPVPKYCFRCFYRSYFIFFSQHPWGYSRYPLFIYKWGNCCKE